MEIENKIAEEFSIQELETRLEMTAKPWEITWCPEEKNCPGNR